jgi:hypothetical protein
MSADRQLDLFSAPVPRPDGQAAAGRPGPPADRLDDTALVAAIAQATQADCRGLAEEAGRRRLVAAVSSLEALCRRFKGFGLSHAVPEQVAALRGLAAIGGLAARAAVTRLIEQKSVQGPGLAIAIHAAASLGCRLLPETVLLLLRDPDPSIRAASAACAPPQPSVIAMLADQLHDLNADVMLAAAMALGRMGQSVARPALLRLLREAPSADLIDAVAAIADETCIVTLRRIASARPELAACVLAALDDIDDPRATAVAAAMRGARD